MDILLPILFTVFSLGVMLFVFYITVIGDIKGAPFVKSSPKEIQDMLDLAEVKKGDLFVDLGSGDGSVLIQAAQRGAKGFGIEINPFLVCFARLRIRYLGLSDKIAIKYGDFSKFSYKDADIIYLYLLPNTAKILKEKLSSELKPKARIISYKASLPGWIPNRERNGLFCYKNTP